MKIVLRGLAVCALAGIVLSSPVVAADVQIKNAQLAPNPNPAVPLAAICTFRTNEPARATLKIFDGMDTREATPSGEFVTDHKLPVLGLRPNTTNTVTIVVEDKNGNTATSSPLEIQTDPLPGDFPPIELKISRPRKMEPGITFVPLLKWPGIEPERDYGLVLGLNAHGEVVWYYHTDHTFADVYRLRNGNLLYQIDRNGRMAEVDMLGNIQRRWHTTGIPKDVSDDSIPVEADNFHHDGIELPSGNFLVLSTEVRTFDDYPASETNPDAEPKELQVIGDVIFEMTPEGNVVQRWKVFDILDPYRIGYGSLGTGFYAHAYEDVLEKPARDWSHTNSIIYDERDDSMILSSYHLDCVYKISRKTGELVWILGNHKGWKEPWRKYLLKPVGDDFRWPYHQHAVKLTPHGTLLMYDNGTHRAMPYDPKAPAEETWSRAVEYRVNEETMEVEQVWSYGGPDDEVFFSPFICDTDWLPERGNVLVTDGGRMKDADGNDTANFGNARHWGRIFELTHESPAEKVWEIVIDDPEGGWAIYRSERMPLYPDGK